MALDRVQPLKLESLAEGGSSLDAGPTEMNSHQDAIDCAGMYVQDAAATGYDTAVYFGRSSGTTLARLTDSSTDTNLGNLVNAVSGATSAHNGLLDVIHYLAEGPGDAYASGMYAVDTNNGPLRTSTAWYTDSTLKKTIMRWDWTYNGPLQATQKLTLYKLDGVTILRTVTDTYSYSGPIRTQRIRTWGTT